MTSFGQTHSNEGPSSEILDTARTQSSVRSDGVWFVLNTLSCLECTSSYLKLYLEKEKEYTYYILRRLHMNEFIKGGSSIYI
ncbi:hypothetical protein HanRHA438_Chr09g0399801 [Helianthus annuus]|nr:hypothetical protein HanRHA438_Chr09g0399801 [Helianthus annuus]